jgi:RNA polymerase sigma factor (sigma-70 family)
MAGRPAGADILNPLDTLFRLGVVGDLSDRQLLHRFLSGRDGADQAAFAELVRRHGAMVLSVCREVLGNAHDAQDAFQATFLVLARKAGSVRNADSLSCWLHGVAYRVARRARSNAIRRRTSEYQVGAMKALAFECAVDRAEAWPELHEEVARLPKRYREPIVLCYLEGLSTEEAALRIGCPVGTVFSRMSRARERLRGRLVRRGLALPAAVLAAGLTRPARAALPANWLNATVKASMGFTGRRVAEAAAASDAATTLARGVLHAMTISKLKVVGAAVLAWAVAMGGARTLGWNGGPAPGRQPAAAPGTDDPRVALTRSIEELETDLDRAARRNAEMQRDLQAIRTRLDALRRSLERAALAASEAAAQLASALEPGPAQAARRLADQLKSHPARPSNVRPRRGVYLMDLDQNDVTLIANEPDPGAGACGSPRWSPDGRRILFDAMPNMDFHLLRIKAIEAGDQGPILTDLGLGARPTFSPDSQRIAFLLHDNAVPGAQAGIYVMQADGSRRRFAGASFGMPLWSPDGRQFLIVGFNDPRDLQLFNLEKPELQAVEIPGYQVFGWPSWADAATVAAIVGTDGAGDTVALIDVSRPPSGKIKDVLFKQGKDPDIQPLWPVYSPRTHRCVFVGTNRDGIGLYSVAQGQAGRPKRLEAGELRRQTGGLAFSPDGRYLLFCTTRPE